MFSAVLECGRSADIHEFFFQATKHSDMEFLQLQVCLLGESQEWYFQVSKRSDNCSNIPRESGFLMFTYSVFRVRNFEICAVLSSNEVDLLMLKN